MASAKRTFTFDKVITLDGRAHVSAREVADMLEYLEQWQAATSMRKLIDETERETRNGNK